tara:strand:- start:695 stop:1498 length:804 start_codon:yes stop_codon:yes gene_type:complete
MNKKILVLYHSSKYSKTNDLDKFIKNYKKHKAGVEHTLLICFKSLDKNQINKRRKKLKKIKFVSFIDPQIDNDFEWGSQKRVAELYKDYFILFLNDFSYPICKNWLKFFSNHIQKKNIIASMGNLSSHAKNSLFRKKNENYFFFLIRIIYCFINYKNFPNPHIRTTGYMCYGKAYLNFFQDKYVSTKRLSHYYESGRKSFYNFFLKNKYSIFVVNSDNKKFKLPNCKRSFTYAYGKQEKLIISDRRTRAYFKSTRLEKKKMTKQAWG